MIKLKTPKETREEFIDDLFSWMEEIFPTLLLGECNCEMVGFDVTNGRARITYRWIPTGVQGAAEFSLDRYPYSGSGVKEIHEHSLKLINRTIVNGLFLKDK